MKQTQEWTNRYQITQGTAGLAVYNATTSELDHLFNYEGVETINMGQIFYI